MTAFVIRHAQTTDLPEVVALIRALAAFEKLTGPDEAAAERLALDFQADRFGLLVAEQGDHVVGYALFFMTYSTFLARPSLYLEDLFVRPAERRTGIASSFLKTLADLAVTRGCGRFEWSVLDWNTSAQEFYRSLGAEVLSEWRICRLAGDALTSLGQV